MAQDLNLLCSVTNCRSTSVPRTFCACVPKIITTFPNPPPDITGVSIKARLVKGHPAKVFLLPISSDLIHGLKETSSTLTTRTPEGINRLSAVLTYNGDAN